MPPPVHVKLGPLTRAIVSDSVWGEKDAFPADQAWANEIEKILSFLVVQEQFERFRSRILARERDGAIAEARTGFYFSRNGFKILRWEPEETLGVPGDLEIAWRDTEPLFLEVKCPSWEGELAKGEIRSGRTRLPKYIHAEGHSIDPAERVLYVVGKALPKFCSTRVNLVVVVDDLFVSPLDLPRDSICGRIAHELTDAVYATVSGVFLLNPVVFREEVEYRVFFIPGCGRPLPEAVSIAFINESARPKTPPWFRNRERL